MQRVRGMQRCSVMRRVQRCSGCWGCSGADLREEVLQLVVGVVDHELLEAVGGEDLRTGRRRRRRGLRRGMERSGGQAPRREMRRARDGRCGEIGTGDASSS